MKDREILNPLKKTKEEKFPDLKALYNDKIREMKKEEQHAKTEEKKAERIQEIEVCPYSNLSTNPNIFI